MQQTQSTERPSMRKTTPKQMPSSFAKALFRGKIISHILTPYPPLDPEQQHLVEMTVEAIEKLGSEISVREIEENKSIPPTVLAKLKEMGLFGLIIPEDYGGFGMSNASYLQILSALSGIDTSITAMVGAHQSIGLKALLLFGTPEQKTKYLPILATGEMIAAFGLTEPEAGSDAGSLKTRAQLSEDGRSYILNGSKIWITNGGLASFFTVFARTEHLSAEGKTEDKITAFIVTRDMRGFSTGPEEKKLGLLGSSTVSLTFENVHVPLENVLGEPGKGFKVAMGVLNNGRLGLAGACSIGTRKAVQMAMDHALQRRQFGQPISDFGMIQSKFADMLSEIYAAEAMARTTAYLMDRGRYDYSIESAMCKVFATEVQWRTINECIQIAGGTGYMKEYGYEKILRDSRIFTIWEGANEILRLFIGLSGLQGPGDALREIARVLKQPLEDFAYAIGVVSEYGVKWLQRKIVTTERLENIDPIFSKEKASLEKHTAEFGIACETLLRKYGKNIVRHQQAIRRVADIAIDLFVMSCSLSRGTHSMKTKNAEKAQLDIVLTRLACRKARRRLVENLRRMRHNDDLLETQAAEIFYKQGGYPTLGRFDS